MPRPRGVILDAGNTLVFVDPARVLEVIRDSGLDADMELYQEAEREARLALSLAVGERATGQEDQFWQDYFTTIFKRTGVTGKLAATVGETLKGIHAVDHLWTHVPEGTEEALETLKERGYRLAVVSNADGRVESLLEEQGLAGHFEFIIDSEVVGFEKPHPRIFEIAVERLGLDPAECLYVGDLYAVDVLGARAAGLRAVLLDPFDALGHWEDVDRIPAVRDLPDYLEARAKGRDVAGEGSGLDPGAEGAAGPGAEGRSGEGAEGGAGEAAEGDDAA